MIKVIQEESISFGSRLKQLMDEKKVSNGTVAHYVGVSKTAVSDWRTGKHPLTRFKEETLEKLAQEFDVDVEYLKCTQIERRKDPAPSAARKRSAKARLKNQLKRITPEEKAQIRKQLQEAKERGEKINGAIQLCSAFDITIEPEIIDSHEEEYTYQIIEDNTIYTIQQTEDVTRESENFTVFFPDGSESIRSADQIISLYESMQRFCIDQLKLDPEK